MPPKVPAPSKGALRALRHIAFGTSCCTVAFSMAIITEERRRRIRTVQKIVENGKKLKSSSLYRRHHTAAAIAIQEAEEQAFRLRSSDSASSNDVPRVLDITWTEEPPVADGHAIDISQEPSRTSRDVARRGPQETFPWTGNTTRSKHRRGRRKSKRVLDRLRQVDEVIGKGEGLHDSIEDQSNRPRNTFEPIQPPKRPLQDSIESPTVGYINLRRIKTSSPALDQKNKTKTKSSSLQSIYAESIERMLDGIHIDDVQGLNSVLDTYFKYFLGRRHKGILSKKEITATHAQQYPDGIEMDNDSPLKDAFRNASQRLCDACIHHKRIDDAARILDHLIKWPLDEECFISFRPQLILEHMTSRSDFQGGKAEDALKFKGLFNRCVRIFCFPFSRRLEFYQSSSGRYPEMAGIGETLCSIALREEDYALVCKIYSRTQIWLSEEFVAGVDSLILALHKLGDHEAVDEFFNEFFKRFSASSPDLGTFFRVIGTVLKCAQKLRSLQAIEEKTISILQVAIDMATKGGYFIPSPWFQTLLGDHWKLTRNFASSKALFEKLETYVERLRHPIALYRTMIQICVEADRVDEIQQYFERPVAGEFLSDIQIRSTLAMAKALSDDWDGVEEELKQMKYLGTKKKGPPSWTSWTRQTFNTSFVPILKLYAKGHSITQIEDFLRRCVSLYGIVPNQYVCNIMIGVYSNADEYDSIPKWLEYAQSHGAGLNATSFNTMLSSFAKKRNHARLYKLYERVKQFDKSLVNQVTLRILEGSQVVETTRQFLGDDETARVRPPEISLLELPLDSHGVLYAMKSAMLRGQYHDAYKLYDDAKHDNRHLHQSTLEIAIEAVLGIGGQGCEDEIAYLLSEAQGEGQDITWALARYMIFHLRNWQTPDQVDKVVREAQARLWVQGISLPLHTVTEAVAILVQRGDLQQALDLWASLNHHRPSHLEPYTPDLPILNVLLKAYIELFDCDGIRWVVRTLVELDIRSDPTLRNELKRGLRMVNRRLLYKQEGSPEYSEYSMLRQTLIEALDFMHEFVEKKIHERKETEKTVLDIMRGAIRDIGGDEGSDAGSSDEFEMEMSKKGKAGENVPDITRDVIADSDVEGASSEDSKTSIVVKCPTDVQLEEPEEPMSLIEYYSKARGLNLVVVPAGS